MDTFESLLPILESDEPDFSAITIRDLNFAINQGLERLSSNRLTYTSGNKPLYRQTLESYVRHLFAAKARKWGERGGSDAVFDQIQKTRRSIATAETGREWYETYLISLQAELDRLER